MPSLFLVIQARLNSGKPTPTQKSRLKEVASIEATKSQVEFNNGDPLGFILDKNLHRRHLDESQRAMVAARIAQLPKGGDRKSENFKGQICTSINDAAEKLNISERSVKAGKKVLSKGVESLQAAVEQGEIAVSEAAQIADLPARDQAVSPSNNSPHRLIALACIRSRDRPGSGTLRDFVGQKKSHTTQAGQCGSESQ